MAFEPKNVALSGSNSIEASAGTGKTYSIAILVLRLILEKELRISEILLVTFTEAAAAELKERTMKFLYLGLKEVQQPGSSGDETIQYIISNCTLEDNKIKDRLQYALQYIDEASICTIHSFCLRILIEFAFETGQTFGKELLSDISDILDLELNKMFRYKVSVIKKIMKGLKADLLNAVNNELAGKSFYTPMSKEALEENYKHIQIRVEELKLKLIQYFDEAKLEEMRYVLDNEKIKYITNEAQKAKIRAQLVNAEKCVELFASGSNSFQKHFEKYKQAFDVWYDELKEIDSDNYLLSQLIHSYAEEVAGKVEQKIAEKNVLTFNDIISKLHEVRDKKQLIQHIGSKFKAVFVDEFQDTDQQQYEIFNSFFELNNSETILFYIGDPKQSIYGWRKADLDTYRFARRQANHLHEMNRNYRSSVRFISAINAFYGQRSIDTLNYIQVDAFEKNNQPGLLCNGQPFPTISINKTIQNKNTIVEAMGKWLNFIFSGTLTLNQNKIRPSDLAILVRTNQEAKKVKSVLARLNIPSVTFNEEKVFDTQEAEELKLILEAILEISISKINRALLTRIIGFKYDEINQVNLDELLDFFYDCKVIWKQRGISKMLYKVLDYFDVIQNNINSIHGLQLLTNTRQMIDILAQKTAENNLTVIETYRFLRDQIQQKNIAAQDQSYTQSIESDEDAVKILTIHKSKGLEFPLVMIPFMSIKAEERSKMTFTNFKVQAKNEDRNQYYYAIKGTLGDNLPLFIDEVKAENDRLLYVALTRAKYNAFIFSRKSDNMLHKYIKSIEERKVSSELIEIKSYDDNAIPKASSNYKAADRQINLKSLKAFTLADHNYHKLSFSSLSEKHEYQQKPNDNNFDAETYEYFIFKQLPKGAMIGNMLHDIFEFSDFESSDTSRLRNLIRISASKFFPSLLESDRSDYFLDNLIQLYQQVVHHAIKSRSTFQLKDLSLRKRINELEFNFSLPHDFNPIALNSALVKSKSDGRSIQSRSDYVKGMMNGFIDLFFEYEGKYYILDWKSNFLGDHPDYYRPTELLKAMNENNYHLQYLIYAVAIRKYLSLKITDFDFDRDFGAVIYVFLRGVHPDYPENGFYIQNVMAQELDEIERALGILA